MKVKNVTRKILDLLLTKYRLYCLRLKYKGDNIHLSRKVVIFNTQNVSIGSNVYIGPEGWINGIGGVEIGSGTIIGPKITIYSANHNFKDAIAVPYDNIVILEKVIIGENVWIGGNVILLPGTELGEGCVVGAGSVVTKSFPPLCIIAGNPARIIGVRDENQYFELKKNGQIYLKLKSTDKFKTVLISHKL